MQILRIEFQGSARFARAASASASELELLSAAPWAGGELTGERTARARARLLEPVTPSKIVCIGRNYAAHAKELGNDIPDEPLLFLKPPSALLAPGAAIVLPRASLRVEHEAEIGLVISRRVRNVSREDALSAVFGVTCVNDVTARDLQRKDVQFTRAKSFDTFCPVGPWIETELALAELTVSCRVNGALRQHAPVSEMAFSFAALVAFISGVMTLEPGDLIATGTPAGVGPLLAGDRVEVEVSGVGVLQNPITSG